MNRRVPLWLVAGVVAVIAWLTPVAAHAQNIVFLPYSTNGQAPLCRFGVNVDKTLGSYPLRPLRFGWYVDYQASAAASQLTGTDYYPIIRLEQVGDGYNFSFTSSQTPATIAQLNQLVDAHPTSYWFIGNEPDRRGFQDDIEPEVYAIAYHDLYYAIKARDPQARVVAGNVVQPTPLRLEYLDRILEAYYADYGVLMPVDVWGFHNFVLNEASCTYYAQFFPGDPNGLLGVCWGADIPKGLTATDGLRISVQDNDNLTLFKQQIVAFRQWLADRGYRQTPVFLSEFGILMPQNLYPEFDDARVNTFMNAAFDYLLTATDESTGYSADGNRLVQRFSWFSIDENEQHNGFLFDPDQPAASARTAMGDNYVAYTEVIDDEVDVFPTQVTMVGTPVSSGGVTTMTLAAEIANQGNLIGQTPVQVMFYDGEPGQGGTLIGVADVNLRGCGETAMAQVTWAAATPTAHTVVVQAVTPAVETDVTNNVLRAPMTVMLANQMLLLPTVATPLQIP